MQARDSVSVTTVGTLAFITDVTVQQEGLLRRKLHEHGDRFSLEVKDGVSHAQCPQLGLDSPGLSICN